MSRRASDLIAGLIEAACILTVLACAAGIVAGCATPGVPTTGELLLRQSQIRDCILSGGHPHLGPGDTIVCE